MIVSKLMIFLLLAASVLWLVVMQPKYTETCPALEQVQTSALSRFLTDVVLSLGSCPSLEPSESTEIVKLGWTLPTAKVEFLKEYNTSAFSRIVPARKGALPSLYQETLLIQSPERLYPEQYLRIRDAKFLGCSVFSYYLPTEGKPFLEIEPKSRQPLEKREQFVAELTNFTISDPCAARGNCSLFITYTNLSSRLELGKVSVPATLKLSLLAISTDGMPPTRETIDAFLRHVTALDPHCET